METEKLKWGPCHTEQFWKENVYRFEEDKFAHIKHLFELVQHSADAITVAVALFDLGEKEDAEKLVWKALQKAPDTQLVVVEAAALFVQFDLREHAYNVAKTYLENTSDAFNSAIHLSVVLSHLKYVEGAQMCLQIAEKNCKTKAERAKLDYFFASNGMPVADLDQHGMAVELFDKFAENYDTQLGILGNNGPSLIFTALQELNLPKKKTRRVLDAGCGTGLCAGFLREYAKELSVIDLSVKMLEVSREKGLYYFLSRTDLSVTANNNGVLLWKSWK